MNKTELVVLVAEKAGVTQKVANDVIGSLTDVIQETLAEGEKVVLTGFGTFEVRNRAARRGKNPRTGEYIQVPGQKSPAFRDGKILKQAVK